MKILNYFILVLFFAGCRPSLEESISRLENNNLLSYEFTGYVGTTDQSFKDYENLKRLKIEDLLNLIEETDNTVYKTYLLWSLIDKKYDNIEDLFLTFRKDTSRMSVMSGCIVSKDVVSSAMYNKLQIEVHRNIEDEYLNNKKYLIDSLVLVECTGDLLFYRITYSNAEVRNYYDLIKRNATQGDEVSIINLSKFQNTEDLDFFLEQDSLLYDIVLNFPNLRFSSKLDEEIMNSSCDNENFDKLLAGYLMIENDFEDIKLRIDSICKYYEAKQLYLSVMELSSIQPIKELIIHNWYLYNIIDNVGFRFLEKQEDFDLVEMLLMGFNIGKGEIEFLDEDYEYDLKGNLFDKFMNLSDDIKCSIIISVISRMNSNDIYVLQRISDSISEPSTNFRKTILNSIRSSKYAFGMFEKLKILTPHLDEESRQDLGRIFRDNRNWDKGNWTSHFEKEFKKLRIEV